MNVLSDVCMSMGGGRDSPRKGSKVKVSLEIHYANHLLKALRSPTVKIEFNGLFQTYCLNPLWF